MARSGAHGYSDRIEIMLCVIAVHVKSELLEEKACKINVNYTSLAICLTHIACQGIYIGYQGGAVGRLRDSQSSGQGPMPGWITSVK